MEQARLIIAIALSLLIFIVWDHFFQPDAPPTKEQVSEVTQKNDTSAISERPVTNTPSEKTTTVSQTAKPNNSNNDANIATDEAPTNNKNRLITVENQFYKLQLSEMDGQIRSFKLKKYHETIQKDAARLDLIDSEKRDYSLLTEITNSNIPNSAHLTFKSTIEQDQFNIINEPLTIELTAHMGQQMMLKKVFTFFPEQYGIGLDLTVVNQSDTTYKGDLATLMRKALPEKGGAYGFEGPSVFIENKLEQVKPKKIEKTPDLSGSLSWSALQDRYFIKAIMPKEARNASIKLAYIEGKEKGDGGMIENRTVETGLTFAPNSSVAKQYELYFGPMRGKVLKQQGHQLQKAINFGWFDFIAKPCVWFMNFFYDNIISNYGIAIIVLTILAKILLWPLGNKSYKSMNQMKKLQPMMAEIREKHKNDKKRMNEELMGLYKLYKINPMGGCLPMVLQIPVFFALYRMLYSAIELRHAPFFGWIQDLSAPDRLFNFNFAIPFMQEPYGIPVLTVIMGATMLLQQKMTPQAGDPTQAKMMMLMPVVFTFIFINFPSGLVLYWLINNILSIGQQQFVAKKYS